MGVTHSLLDNSKAYHGMQAALAELHGGYVKSGFPEGKPVGAATKNKANAKPYESMSEVARVAVWNEYGVDQTVTATIPAHTRASDEGLRSWVKTYTAKLHIKIPSRPFFRTAIDGNREKILAMSDKFANLALIGKITVDQAFENLGLYMQSIIRASIRSNIQPPNADRTKAAKHSTRTLIDSGQMVNSVTFVKVTGKNTGTGSPEVVKA